ncbi:hypothetical protein C8R42DRAFT_556952, partial [Lentinula raphanica]
HPKAGKVLRVSENVHEKWKRVLSGKEEDVYSLFGSRLDWEISQWAVKEKVSQASFN